MAAAVHEAQHAAQSRSSSPAHELDMLVGADLDDHRLRHGGRTSVGAASSASAFMPAQRRSTTHSGFATSPSPVDDVEFSSPVGRADSAWIALPSGRATPAGRVFGPPSPRQSALPGLQARRVPHCPLPVGARRSSVERSQGVWERTGFEAALDGALAEEEDLRAVEGALLAVELRLRDCENDPMALQAHAEVTDLTKRIDRVRRGHHAELLDTLDRGIRC